MLYEVITVLFCVLPSTPETRHLLDAQRLALLPNDAALINAGRGSLIDEAALLARLDAGLLRFVLLDVFAEEPLPPTHPFWNHPRVIITPHVAADTVPRITSYNVCYTKLLRCCSGSLRSGRRVSVRRRPGSSASSYNFV